MQYELDRLGWYLFEELIQAILKAELGFDIEAWSGPGDRGRDAYVSRSVRLRDGSQLPGPIVFQAKFVSAANARGSKYQKPLLDACRAEVVAIGQRRDSGNPHPASYVLLTNCTLSAADRDTIHGILSHVIDGQRVILGSKDLIALLNNHPAVVRSFPQILSYNHLLSLLHDQFNAVQKERTQAALESAAGAIDVFVPTGAYSRAWQILNKHNFVVLTGPPEMGKTSIAWAIAMAQFANGFEVIECRSPEEIFSAYDSKSKQVFVVDDAFGRTEYLPFKGAMWEGQLHHVIQRLNERHWLIWTSRRHILERAVRDMDLQGKAAGYPRPAEIVVQADKLSVRERALILYRHAVNANLTDSQKAIVRNNASAIVHEVHFTPERIRRLVKELIPEKISKSVNATDHPELIAKSIKESLQNPTDRMLKEFKKLPPEEKWVLISLLDENAASSLKHLETRYRQISPVQSNRSLRDIVDELDESFLRVWRAPHDA